MARGLILPFTVATSFFVLHARPSSLILFACSIVTVGFFIGVFLDGTTVSLIGVSFGVASSFLTSIHAVVIKRSLDVVKGNALHLSWYTNVLSAAVLAPIVLVVGEGPGIVDLFFGDRSGNNNVLWTFIWGSLITVNVFYLWRVTSC